jgi:hypothetical protein
MSSTIYYLVCRSLFNMSLSPSCHFICCLPCNLTAIYMMVIKQAIWAIHFYSKIHHLWYLWYVHWLSTRFESIILIRCICIVVYWYIICCVICSSLKLFIISLFFVVSLFTNHSSIIAVFSCCSLILVTSIRYFPWRFILKLYRHSTYPTRRAKTKCYFIHRIWNCYETRVPETENTNCFPGNSP